MGYESLIRRAWRTGDFSIKELLRDDDAPAGMSREELRRKVKKEMEDIIAREAGDAPAVLSAHKEGSMKLAPFVKFREEKFGAVLFETRSEKVYTLSPTGAAVVREIVSGADAGSLVSRLQKKYSDRSGKLAREAESFLADLKKKGLVTE
ncbi:MAG: PqqD family protein [Elusimicrobia bacterium]|nr:PqqD family protein [Elusimicrobiota bacterium]